MWKNSTYQKNEANFSPQKCRWSSVSLQGMDMQIQAYLDKKWLFGQVSNFSRRTQTVLLPLRL